MKPSYGCLKTVLLIFIIIIIYLVANVFRAITLKEKRQEVKEMYLAGAFDKKDKDGRPKDQNQNFFIVPKDWLHYTVKNAFTISLPFSMKMSDDSYSFENEQNNFFSVNENSIIFRQKEFQEETLEEETYSRVMINYVKSNSGEFAKAKEQFELSLEDIRYFQDLARQSAAPKKIIGNPMVRVIRLSEIYAVEVEYYREGFYDDRTKVFSYYLFNNDEYVNLLVAYTQKDASKWEKDLSNVVKTFKWSKIK